MFTKKFLFLLIVPFLIVDAQDRRNLFDCENYSSCKVAYREDFEYYLQLKYEYKTKIQYLFDVKGMYYMAYSREPFQRIKRQIRVPVKFSSIVRGNIIYSLNIDGYTGAGTITAFDKNKAQTVWSLLLEDTPTFSPILHGNTIYVPNESGRFISINATTGKKNWSYLVPGSILIKPIFYSKYIVLLDDSGNIFWIDRETGSYFRNLFVEEMPLLNPIVRDGKLFVANSRGYVYSIDLEEAKIIWRDNATAGELSRVLFGKKGMILSSWGKYTLIDYSNGSKIDISNMPQEMEE